MNTHNDPRLLEDTMATLSQGNLVQDRDRTCRHCQYDLTGLRYGKPCPECGNEITYKTSRDKRLARDQMQNAPIWYIRTIKFGFIFLTFGFLGLGGVVYTTTHPSPSQTVEIVTPWLTLFWIVGIAMLCINIPSTTRVKRNPNEKFWIRLVMSLSQIGWLGALSFVMGDTWNTTVLGMPTNIFIARLLAFGSFLSLVALPWVISKMLEWMADYDFTQKLQNRTAITFVLLGIYLAGGTTLIVLDFFITAAILFAPIYFIWMFGHCASQASWTLNSAKKIRDAGLRKMHQRDSSMAQAHEESLSRPHNAPVTKLWKGQARRGNWN